MLPRQGADIRTGRMKSFIISRPLVWIGALACTAAALAVTTARPTVGTVWSLGLVAGGVFLSLAAMLRARRTWQSGTGLVRKSVVAGLLASGGALGLFFVLLFYDLGFHHPSWEERDGEFVVKSWTVRGFDAHHGSTQELYFRDTLVTERLDSYVHHPTRENVVIFTSFATDDTVHHTHVFDGETLRTLRIGSAR